MTILEHLQTRAFARIDGAYLGILWTISFACYIMGLSQPVIGMIGTATALATPFFAARRLGKFRDEVLDGSITTHRFIIHTLYMFFYASILFAVAQYAYFEFIDDGFIVRQYTGMMSSPEAQELLKAYGLTVKQAMESIEQLADTTPIAIAVNIMGMNLVLGLLLTIPVNVMTRKNKK